MLLQEDLIVNLFLSEKWIKFNQVTLKFKIKVDFFAKKTQINVDTLFIIKKAQKLLLHAFFLSKKILFNLNFFLSKKNSNLM